MKKVLVLGYRDKCPDDYTLINTTSKSTNWSRGLSPFFVGQKIHLYGNFFATNLENAWQFSKLYKEFGDENGNPTDSYYRWAVKGWGDTFAHRYPMGKGAIPLCSMWNGKALNYIEARKKIYIPLYSKEVVKTNAYKQLKTLYDSGCNIALLDFDGYDYLKLGYTFKDVILDPKRKMGHAFVLAMLLEEAIIIKDNKISYNESKLIN